MTHSDMQLRRVRSEDADEIHQLFCVPEVYEFLADGVAPPRSVADSWIDAATIDAARSSGGLWALTRKVNHRIFGLVRLSGATQGRLELTYLLHPEVWGLGHATRMAHTAMAHAFGSGLISAIWAGADAPNAASIAVMKRLGMKYWRSVYYPLGAGLEYIMEATAFDSARIELLSID